MSPEEEGKKFIDACIAVSVRQCAGSPVLPDILPPSPMGSNPYPGAHSDFYGLPSYPISIYHTGAAFPKRTGPEAQRIPREARPVCVHPITSVWNELGQEIYEYFDSIDLKWTTIDPVRFAEAGKEPGPVFLWVGVMPKSLSYDDAKAAGAHCKQILERYQLSDVEIAFRDPFTGALGIQIAPKAYPHFGGTGSLYFREGGEHDRVLLLTPRHVVFPPSEYANEFYARKTTRLPRREVILLGSKAYQNVLKAIMAKIGDQTFMVSYYKDNLERLGEEVKGEDNRMTDARKRYTDDLAREEESIRPLTEFYSKTTRFWSIESQRIIGHVLHAPPISVGTGDKRFTENWALVELHGEKFNNWEGFKGNVMYLGGNKISIPDLIFKMNPHAESCVNFEYPLDRLLQLRDTVKENELRNPPTCDANGEPCLLVIKNGNTTGVTVGRATGIESFIREYLYGICTTSRAIAIYPYSYKDGAFSAPGDSGSVIADANGRIVGILTGGAGGAGSTDVTYATPYYWVEERIKAAFPDSYLFPTEA